MIGITYKQLLSFNPCADELKDVRKALGGEVEWGDKCVTAQMARDAGASFENILWAASAVSETDKEVARRLQHFVADCAARVLHVYERERPGDRRVRDSIIAARDGADGRIDADARRAAFEAALDAAWCNRAPATWNAATAAARAASGATTWATTWAVSAAKECGERAWQFDRLIAWLSENEPQPLPLPEMEAA